jgi:hypothetical protein
VQIFFENKREQMYSNDLAKVKYANVKRERICVQREEDIDAYTNNRYKERIRKKKEKIIIKFE